MQTVEAEPGIPADQNERALRPVAPVRPAFDDETIDLTTLFWAWVKWSWVIVLGVAMGAYYGYRGLEAFVPTAVATMTVMPAQSTDAPAVATGGLAAAAATLGLQVGGATKVSLFDRFKLTLGSIELADTLQRKYNLMQRVFSSSWDPVAHDWIRPAGSTFERDQQRRSSLRMNLWAPPNLESLAAYVSGAVKVDLAKTPGLYTLTVNNVDPDFALWLLSTAFAESDARLRENDRQDSVGRLSFIQGQMENRPLVYMQDAFRNMLVQELSRAVLLQSDRPYAATIVEPPRVLNAHTEPALALLFGAPMAAGGVAAFVLITLFAVIRRERR